MTTLTVHPKDSEQDLAIRAILDALHVQYEDDGTSDETEYLNASPAMASHLDQSFAQAQNGHGVKINPDTLLPE